jgi:hypothetical protein
MGTPHIDATRRSIVFAAGAAACSALASCATGSSGPPPPNATTAPLPVPRPGEYWEFAVRDAYIGEARGLYRYSVTRIDANQTVVEVARDGQRMDTYVYAPGWNAIEQPLTNLQRFRYEPPFPSFEFPLYAGQRWSQVVRATDPASGRSYRVHVQASVGGWQRMRVPAGEFEALEVRRYVYAGNAEYFKLQEEIFQRDWYAPTLGYVVMSEGNSSHIDTSRSGGGRGRPLRVRGDWLIAELVRHGVETVGAPRARELSMPRTPAKELP